MRIELNLETGEQTEHEDAPVTWVEETVVIVPPTVEQNKATASGLLTATDWTTIADVGNPQTANPYLANQAEFLAYRNTVRNMAVYPIEGNLTWPTVPTENWVKV